LLGWAPTGGTREIFSRDELVEEFSLERVTPSPAVFDMEKLYWLNRHYIKQASPERIEKLAFPYYGLAIATELAEKHGGIPASDYPWPPAVVNWFEKVTQLLAPYVDRLDQFPEKAKPILEYDAAAALAAPDNAEVLAMHNTDAVIARFTVKVLEDESAQASQLTPERFNQIVGEVKAETGAKGKELFHPIRIIVMGSHSGPAFDKLVPILEEGSHLSLPKHVLNVRERVEAFAKARCEVK
jgi:nondiscriminating glutamyl-tRNA synthetase